jgi:hypothetical protein
VVGRRDVSTAFPSQSSPNHHSTSVVRFSYIFRTNFADYFSGYFEHCHRDPEDNLTVSHIAWLILKYDCHIKSYSGSKFQAELELGDKFDALRDVL